MSDEFINHLMVCKACYGAACRYCSEGTALKIECDAEYFAGELAKLATKDARQRFMEIHAKNYFDRPALDEAIKAKYLAMRQDLRAAA